jgi:hypothetical protein
MPRPGHASKVLQEHGRLLERLANRRGVGQMRDLYNAGVADMEERMRSSPFHKGDATFTARDRQVVLAQLKQGQAALAPKLSKELGNATRDAQKDSLSLFVDNVHRLEKDMNHESIALPVEEASRFYGVIDQRRTSLLTRHESSIATYGANTIKKVEKQLALSLVTGETQDQAIDRVIGTTKGEVWQAERIVRTEMAWAFNATQADALAETADDFPDMRMRWSEHVDDFTGAPLDDRVAPDSIELHGQVAKPGATFIMPPDPETDGIWDGLLGKRWAFPPDRPNDRAVLQPWRASWGVPAWEWRRGRKFWLVDMDGTVAEPEQRAARAPRRTDDDEPVVVSEGRAERAGSPVTNPDD